MKFQVCLDFESVSFRFLKPPGGWFSLLTFVSVKTTVAPNFLELAARANFAL